MLAIEVKTWRDGDKTPDPVAASVQQLDHYLARTGATDGWAVLFDQRTKPGEPQHRVEELILPSGRVARALRLDHPARAT